MSGLWFVTRNCCSKIPVWDARVTYVPRDIPGSYIICISTSMFHTALFYRAILLSLKRVHCANFLFIYRYHDRGDAFATQSEKTALIRTKCCRTKSFQYRFRNSCQRTKTLESTRLVAPLYTFSCELCMCACIHTQDETFRMFTYIWLPYEILTSSTAWMPIGAPLISQM